MVLGQWGLGCWGVSGGLVYSSNNTGGTRSSLDNSSGLIFGWELGKQEDDEQELDITQIYKTIKILKLLNC